MITSLMLSHIIKEFASNVAYLLCLSRLGFYSFAATSFSVLTVLVVFSLPILNQYFMVLVQMGSPSPVFRTVPLVTAEILGGVAAGYIRVNLWDSFGVETYINSSTLGLASHSLVNTHSHNMPWWWVFEELFAVLFLLVGLYNLLLLLYRENPASLYLYLTAFINAMVYMFPTAHFSASATIYLIIVSSATASEGMYRLLGASIATMLAISYAYLADEFTMAKDLQEIMTKPTCKMKLGVAKFVLA